MFRCVGGLRAGDENEPEGPFHKTDKAKATPAISYTTPDTGHNSGCDRKLNDTFING